MEKRETLGMFDYKYNGTIHVKMGSNMRFGSEAITYIHELYHKRLNDFTSLGMLLIFIDMASQYEEGKNGSVLYMYGNVLYNNMRKVQEVYATSMTWLWLMKTENEKYRKQYIQYELQEYKRYRNELIKIIDDDNSSIQERQKKVDIICRYALDVELDNGDFWSAIEDAEKFSEYVGDMINPNNRMKSAYDKLVANGTVPATKTEDMIELYDKLSRLEIFGKMRNITKKVEQEMLNMKRNPSLYDQYIQLIQKKVKVFDISLMKINTKRVREKGTFDVSYIIKRCDNIKNKDNYFEIQHGEYKGKSIYYGQEICEVENIVQGSEFVIIPFSEYDRKRWKPYYFVTSKPIMVLIDNYNECKEWGENLLDTGEVYWGDIYPKEVNNFFTVNFFVRRGKENVIFVFPTTKGLSIGLQKELGISKQVLTSIDDEFYKIFGVFKSGTNIFKVYNSIMAFLLDSTGNISEDIAMQMVSADMGRTIINACMNLHNPDNYFEQMMYFPTKQTVGNGRVWVLMQFVKRERIGNMKAEIVEKDGEEINGLLVFESKVLGIQYLNNHKDLENYEPVEMDRYFWNYYRNKLRESDWKILLLKRGKLDFELVDMEKLEYMIYTN